MITITIGTNGRFGNQMFQYASLMGIADKQNCLYGINYKFGSGHTWNEFPDDRELVMMFIYTVIFKPKSISNILNLKFDPNSLSKKKLLTQPKIT